MNKVTVNLNLESLYEEPDSKIYRIKRKLTYNTILKVIRNGMKGKNKFSLLEIGSGSGFLLAFLEIEFPESNIFGLEYDPRLVALTQKKVKRAKIIQGNAEDFELHQKFDIIVSLQVIEHLYHPELMLTSVKNHLNKDGIFILTTPNLDCFSAKVLKEKWHGFRDDHVCLKNVSMWNSFIEKHGLISIYFGSTFFSGLPLLNRFPFGILNWSLLYFIGSLKWKYGESFVGIYKNT